VHVRPSAERVHDSARPGTSSTLPGLNATRVSKRFVVTITDSPSVTTAGSRYDASPLRATTSVVPGTVAPPQPDAAKSAHSARSLLIGPSVSAEVSQVRP